MQLRPTEKVPEINIDLVNDAQWVLSEQDPEHFTMVVFYRGHHCPVCKSYLEALQDRISKFTDMGIHLIAISSDSEERAKKSYEEWSVSELPMGYGMAIEEASAWGLYTSKGISDEEPDAFIEPGVFLVRPDNTLYSAAIQSMPFARPDWDALLKGLEYIIKKEYPARGAA